MKHRKFGTLMVEDLEEEEPTAAKSSKPKKVRSLTAAHRPRAR